MNRLGARIRMCVCDGAKTMKGIRTRDEQGKELFRRTHFIGDRMALRVCRREGAR